MGGEGEEAMNSVCCVFSEVAGKEEGGERGNRGDGAISGEEGG